MFTTQTEPAQSTTNNQQQQQQENPGDASSHAGQAAETSAEGRLTENNATGVENQNVDQIQGSSPSIAAEQSEGDRNEITTRYVPRFK